MDKFIKLTQKQIDKCNLHGCGLLALQFNAAVDRITELERTDVEEWKYQTQGAARANVNLLNDLNKAKKRIAEFAAHLERGRSFPCAVPDPVLAWLSSAPVINPDDKETEVSQVALLRQGLLGLLNTYTDWTNLQLTDEDFATKMEDHFNEVISITGVATGVPGYFTCSVDTQENDDG